MSDNKPILNPPRDSQSLDIKSLDTLSLRRLLEPISEIHTPFYNWAKTFVCLPYRIYTPSTYEECELVLALSRRLSMSIRIVGVGHSPSDIACTSAIMLRTTKLDKIIQLTNDGHTRTVIAEAGIKLSTLHELLATENLAMSNLGSISDQTLGGLLTTGSHGTGLSFGILSTYVLSLYILLADGTYVRCSRSENTDLFLASLCGLGCTGLVLEIEMQVEESFRLRETHTMIPFKNVINYQLDSVVKSGEHVRLWWFPAADMVLTSIADRTQQPAAPNPPLWHETMLSFHLVQLLLYLAHRVPFLLFPFVLGNPMRVVARLTAWISRLAASLVEEDVAIDDSWKIFNVECRYLQHTTEWAIPYENTQSCLEELRTFFSEGCTEIPVHFPLEVRFSAPDDIWLSPSYGRATTWIGVVLYKPYNIQVPYLRLFANFERILSKYGGRPHWAKAHPLRNTPSAVISKDNEKTPLLAETASFPSLPSLYPQFASFTEVVKGVDPEGVWRNEYIRRHIFGEDVDPISGQKEASSDDGMKESVLRGRVFKERVM